LRLLAIILSIYTITLTALPCDDNNVIGLEQLTSIVESSDYDNHNSVDFCPPFCSCICCSVITAEPMMNHDSSFSKTNKEELNTSYLDSFSKKHHTKIVQPPQV
jgi:hypothetical protein